MMFWGLILKPKKKYTQTVTKAFHLSGAACDLNHLKDNEQIQVLLNSEDDNFLLCTLSHTLPQAYLDLNFAEGDKICFTTTGSGMVHLTGYLIPDDEELGEEEDMDTEVEEAAAVTKSKKKAAQEENDDDEAESDDESFDMENAKAAESDGDEEEGEEEEEEVDTEDMSAEDESEEEAPAPEPVQKKAKLDKEKPQNGVDKKDKKKDKQEQKKPQEQTLAGGVKIVDTKLGNGPVVKPGQKITVYYEGRFQKSNKVFDASKSGKGFKFALGKGKVIKAWDVGLVGMKVGGKRRILTPPHMAYGSRGSPPVIPPNAALMFDIEVLKIN